MEDEIINRVAESSLLTLNLEDFFPQEEVIIFDMKDVLYQEIILKEKDFRDFVKNEDWTKYSGKNVAIICSADAIIPTWAYMLLVTRLTPFVSEVIIGNREELDQLLFKNALKEIDLELYRDKKVIVKGCSTTVIPLYAYGDLTRLLTPVVSSLMYGEPCSSVPLFKKKVAK